MTVIDGDTFVGDTVLPLHLNVPFRMQRPNLAFTRYNIASRLQVAQWGTKCYSLFSLGEPYRCSICFWPGFFFFLGTIALLWGLHFIYLWTVSDWRSFKFSYVVFFFSCCAFAVAALIVLTTCFFWSVFYCCIPPLLHRNMKHAAFHIRKGDLFQRWALCQDQDFMNSSLISILPKMIPPLDEIINMPLCAKLSS